MSGLRILWNIHLYPPNHNCGSERVAHEINKYLIAKGHHVRVMLNQAKMHNVEVPYTYEGVEVFGPSESTYAYDWADVMITHLDYTQHSIQLAHILRKPVITFVHNSHKYDCVETAIRDNYIVYNSKWVADTLNYEWPSMIMPPPCDPDYYNVCADPSNNEFITLINLDVNKGGQILSKLAKAMPNKKFLGVMGSYSEPSQFGQITDQPPNVKVVPNTPDIRGVYKQTRILLMLSQYESWGRTGTEAMCNGIPVIATPTPGLKENLAGAGIFVNKRPDNIKDSFGNVFRTDLMDYDIGPIIKQINKLVDKKYYKAISDACRRRSTELSPGPLMEQLEQFIWKAAYNTQNKVA